VVFPILAKTSSEVLASLKRELVEAKGGKERVPILSEMIWSYAPFSLDSSVFYSEMAIADVNQPKDPILLSQAYSDLGYPWMEKGELLKARQNYQEALRIRYELGNPAKIYATVTHLGSLYQRDFQLDSAIVNYLKTLSFFESTGNERNVDFTRNNIGVINSELKNYSKVRDTLEKEAAYREENEENYNLAMTYNNLGAIYRHLDQDNKSEEVYLKALEILRDYEDVYYTAKTYNNLATLYNSQMRSKLAIEYASKGLGLAKKTGVWHDYSLLESNLAKSYTDLRDFQKSKQYYLQALSGFKSQNAEEDVMTMYLLMSPVYAALNMPDCSAHYTKAYISLLQKLNEHEILQLTSDLETRYQTEKKDKEFAEKELALSTKNIQIFGSLGLALVLALVGYLLYAHQKLKNQLLRQEGKLKVALAQLDTQNLLHEQRMLISRDLYDNIGAQLTYIISAIENLKMLEPIKETLTHRYDSIANFTKQTITELRDMIWAMNSGQISWDQLNQRISDYMLQAGISTMGIHFEFEVEQNIDKNHKLTSSEGIQIYRIIQEAIQNSLKYAYPSEINVVIGKAGNGIIISIQDNGSGFDEATITPGNGLYNMRKRAEEIGGNLAIQSIAGKGTIVRLELTLDG
jgi:signal transduction histidine kinase